MFLFEPNQTLGFNSYYLDKPAIQNLRLFLGLEPLKKFLDWTLDEHIKKRIYASIPTFTEAYILNLNIVLFLEHCKQFSLVGEGYHSNYDALLWSKPLVLT